jgi:hypothetical protein
MEIVAPRTGGAGIGGIGEVAGVSHARALLFSGDFPIEFTRHAREFGDNGFDLCDASAFLFRLEAL